MSDSQKERLSDIRRDAAGTAESTVTSPHLSRDNDAGSTPAAPANALFRFDNAKRRRPDSHARQAMLTPAYVLEPIRTLLGGIGLDPCTEPDNPTRAERFYCLPADGAKLSWDARSVFCNPPYGEARARWVDRCISESASRPVVLLIPAHPDTNVVQKALISCTSVLFVRSRLRFGVLRESGQEEAASHGSAIFGFGVDVEPLRNLGVVLRPATEPQPRLI